MNCGESRRQQGGHEDIVVAYYFHVLGHPAAASGAGLDDVCGFEVAREDPVDVRVLVEEAVDEGRVLGEVEDIDIRLDHHGLGTPLSRLFEEGFAALVGEHVEREVAADVRELCAALLYQV